MPDEIENQNPDASGNKANQPPETPTPTTPTPAPQMKEPKVEIKDGITLINGKKYVPESDLLAAKKGLESQLETAQTTHNQSIDAARLELSAEQQKVADLSAQLQQAKEGAQAGVTSDEEVTRIKNELATAQSSIESLTNQVNQTLDLRRRLLAIQYSIPVESLADKDMQALDSFEEALKALGTSRAGGPGKYAIGGGGTEAKPMTDMERAKQNLANTPYKGVREPEPAAK